MAHPFANQLAFIDSSLDSIFQLATNFTWTRFIGFEPPDKYKFSYDSTAQHYNFDECYRYCAEASKGDDLCLEPLQLLTKGGIKNFPKFKKPFFKRHLEFLMQIGPTQLVFLTPLQRQYLAKIHGSEILQNAIRSLLKTAKEEAIIHGDYRMANLLFRKKQPFLHVIDWELCEIGPFVYDWSTLITDYIALYLTHYLATKGKPQTLKWQQIEQLFRRHFGVLAGCAKKNINNLSKDYLQWIGIFLLNKGCIIANKTAYGIAMSDLLFQMGRRFLIEYDQLQKKYL